MAKKRATYKKKANGKNATGAPGFYKPEYDELVFKLCLLGATDKEIADILCIEEATLNNWKKEHPDFFESMKRGKDKADAEIAHSLYHRAKGYEHEDLYLANYQGRIIEKKITKHYPPDTAAAFIWLKNRQSARWRDKQEIEHSGIPQNLNIVVDSEATKTALNELRGDNSKTD